MKARLVLAVFFLFLLAATAQVAFAAAPDAPRAAGAAWLPFTPSFASVINKTSGCTANLTCPNGTPISCSSGVPSTCTVGTNYVDCNGARTNCPTDCYIERPCCNGTIASCEGTTSCVFYATGVRCDGRIISLCISCPDH